MAILLFTRVTLVGLYRSIQSSSVLFLWVAIEINLFGFLPLIYLLHDNIYKSELGGIYFINQCVGSLILISLQWNYISEYLSWCVIFFSLILKAGLAPAHFWYLKLIRYSPWNLCFFLSTIQKIIPILIFTHFLYIRPNLSIFFGSLMAIIGAIRIYYQASFRGFLACSSISYLGWVFSASFINSLLSILFWFNYIFLTSISIFIFIYNEINSPDEKLFLRNEDIKFYLRHIFLNIRGLPPFSSFFLKIILINDILFKSIFIPVFIFLLARIIALKSYIKIMEFIINITIIKIIYFSIKAKSNLLKNGLLIYYLIFLLRPFIIFIIY